jgi:hypothetical protein
LFEVAPRKIARILGLIILNVSIAQMDRAGLSISTVYTFTFPS